MIELHPGDNRESLRRLIDQGVRVHSVVTDPPYALDSVVKRFGKAGAAPARTENNDGSFGRLSGDFIGKTWDGTGIERDPEFWALVLEILLPGGCIFAFSGSRTSHWQACAMETAGFIIHPLHGWTYGTGFSKAHSASKAITKAFGEAGAGPAEQWEGWAYGTQTQKPALEPIILAQKPFSEKTGPKNLLEHGVGAFNIDSCRVQPSGRYPANLMHDGSEAALSVFPCSSATFFNCFPPDCDPVFYNAKAGKADRAGSKHPTVKPIALMRHLIRHITPPGGTVLDPFAGSGTTAEAALLEGFDCILMEAEPEYLDFLRERFDGRGLNSTPDSEIALHSPQMECLYYLLL
jgi:DNA modification methylase